MNGPVEGVKKIGEYDPNPEHHESLEIIIGASNSFHE